MFYSSHYPFSRTCFPSDFDHELTLKKELEENEQFKIKVQTSAHEHFLSNRGHFNVLNDQQSQLVYENENLFKLMKDRKITLDNVNLLRIAKCIITVVKTNIADEDNIGSIHGLSENKILLDLKSARANFQTLNSSILQFTSSDNKSLHLYNIIELYYETIDDIEGLKQFNELRIMSYETDLLIFTLLENILNNRFLSISSNIDLLYTHKYLIDLNVSLSRILSKIDMILEKHDKFKLKLEQREITNNLVKLSVFITLTVTMIIMLSNKL
jgi:hypothetical protein